MVSNLWMLSGVVLPGGTITQITDQDMKLGIDEIMAGGSGSPDVQFIAVGEQKPVLSFTTTALATALGVAGLDCYEINSASDWYFQKVQQGGVRATGAAHLKMTCSKGMLVPKKLEAKQGKEPASISYDLYPISSDGTTAPLVLTTGATLPNFGIVSELFTLGPVSINGSALQAVQSMSWDFKMKEEHHGSEGAAYPTFCGVATRGPVCAINGFDLTALDTFGVGGLALTDFKTYFRKIREGSTREPDSNAVHIRLQGAKGMLLPQGAKGKYDKPLDGDWNICASSDGSNDILSISSTSNIA